MSRLAVVLLFIACACDQYEKPNRPLPDDFAAASLTGARIDRETLKGRPWVVNIWLPG